MNSSNVEKILAKYYKKQLLAERNFVIMKWKNEQLIKYLTRMKVEKDLINRKTASTNKIMIEENNALRNKIKLMEGKIENMSANLIYNNNTITSLQRNVQISVIDNIYSNKYTKEKIDLIEFEISQLTKNFDELENLALSATQPDKDNTKDIWEAVAKGSLPGVKFYLEQDPSNLNKLIPNTNYHLIYQASDYGYLYIVKYLLSKGASVDTLNIWRYSPLMCSCSAGHLSIIRLLLDKGANINLQDVNMDTPLHWAVRNNHLNAVKYLIARGADKTIQNRNYGTPLDLARRFKYTSIIAYLSPQP